jgi:hypothetical protein
MNRSICVRNCFLIAYPIAAFLRRGTGYEMINEGAQGKLGLP